jgi:DNA-binding IclR family transcriptional regulator
LDDDRMTGEARSVKSAERVFDVLERVMQVRGGESFMQIGKALKIPKSSLFALLGAMERRQYLELDPESRQYRLGLRTLELGQAYLRGQDLVETARQAMEVLVAEVNETAQLARLAGADNVYLARVDSSHALRLQSEPGTRLPAQATGIGKALLSLLSGAEIEELFGTGALPTYSPTSLKSVAALNEELELTRRRGFALDNEEYTAGVFCLAVPVYEAPGRAQCAVSVSIPVTRVEVGALPRILAKLAECSLSVSRRMGAGQPDPVLAQLADTQAAAERIAELRASGRYSFSFG